MIFTPGANQSLKKNVYMHAHAHAHTHEYPQGGRDTL